MEVTSPWSSRVISSECPSSLSERPTRIIASPAPLRVMCCKRASSGRESRPRAEREDFNWRGTEARIAGH